jgi:hypothetical protein
MCLGCWGILVVFGKCLDLSRGSFFFTSLPLTLNSQSGIVASTPLVQRRYWVRARELPDIRAAVTGFGFYGISVWFRVSVYNVIYDILRYREYIIYNIFSSPELLSHSNDSCHWVRHWNVPFARTKSPKCRKMHRNKGTGHRNNGLWCTENDSFNHRSQP